MQYLKELSNEEIESHRLFFDENHFLLLRDILTDEAIELFKTIEFSDDSLRDRLQFGRRHGLHMTNDEIVQNYHTETLEFFKRIIGEKYFKTCAFAMEYIKGSKVNPHLDFVINEVSTTVCFNTNGNYPIYVDRRFTENNYNFRYTLNSVDEIPEECKVEFCLNSGDIIMFNGRNHFHWRNELTEDITYQAILAHYSFTKGGSEEWKQKMSQDVPKENSFKPYGF